MFSNVLFLCIYTHMSKGHSCRSPNLAVIYLVTIPWPGYFWGSKGQRARSQWPEMCYFCAFSCICRREIDIESSNLAVTYLVAIPRPGYFFRSRSQWPEMCYLCAFSSISKKGNRRKLVNLHSHVPWRWPLAWLLFEVKGQGHSDLNYANLFLFNPISKGNWCGKFNLGVLAMFVQQYTYQ